jgi:D-alanyl-D-alanine carboxypeptidase/D-alanyl-D-alanine-endopeptidase (penicillin-binding protein 4)
MLRSHIHVRRVLIVGLLFSLLLPCAGRAALSARIGTILNGQIGTANSIHVVEPESGRTVYAYKAREALIPASNMKLITTAAAVKYLGGTFEYRTRVGLCDNTLVVIGSGDPLLGDDKTDARHGRQEGWVLEAVADALEAREIDEINDIVVDTTVFDNERVHPSWPAKDHNKWYACEVCGLNYNTNCVDVTTNNYGGAVAVTIEPSTSFIRYVNEVEPISSGSGAVGSYRNRQPNHITIYGKCKKQQGPFPVAVEQPAAFFGVLLAEHLLRQGINTRGHLIEKALPEECDFNPVVTFTTPLSDVLRRANTDSLGLAAEALLKTIAAHESPDGTGGGWPAGRELLGTYLRDLGVAAEEFHIDDGSGLSRENRLSADAITSVLLALYRSNDWDRFKASLAVAGETGTIGRYFKESAYRGRILGKTGYIRGVKSFSGVCETENGPYLFAILSNAPYGLSRDAINGIAKAIVDEFESED